MPANLNELLPIIHKWVDAQIPKADVWSGNAPLWHAWALRKAFLAGHDHAATRIEALEQALRPFANAASRLERYGGEPGMKGPLYAADESEGPMYELLAETDFIDGPTVRLEVHHLFDARAALAQTGEPTG